MNMDVATLESATRKRYGKAAETVEASLCCAPTDYDAALLQAIPKDVLNVDYGCGNPSKWIEPGETVLDLGSGSGKICFIASQVVGSAGRVVGVDFNPPMLKLARGAKSQFVDTVGYDNVAFLNGRIQDLALNLDLLGDWIRDHPMRGSQDYLDLSDHAEHLRSAQPLIADSSIDVIISNCVLNLVRPDEKTKLFDEMYRVLRPGGRCVISDIAGDERVPAHMQADPDLWSGCISGALTEEAFLVAFEQAGFHGIEIVERGPKPWRVVEGIEFRSVTVRAFKGKQGPCLERNQAVIYRGPWKSVVDDDGHTLSRGVPMAVCDKTFKLYNSAPYAASIIPVPPRVEIPLAAAQPFDCNRDVRRDPAQTKGAGYHETVDTSEACSDDGGCC